MDLKKGIWEPVWASGICRRWRAFFSVMLGPWTALLLAGTLYLSALLVRQTSKEVIAVFTCIVALASGILGGMMGKRWDELVEERVLAARGRSATRDLKLLLRGVASLAARVREYLEMHVDAVEKGSQDADLVSMYLEEIVLRCNTVMEEVVNAIETWVDVVPEVEDLATRIGVISDLTENIRVLQEQRDSYARELRETRDSSESAVRQLKEGMARIETELRQARAQLRVQRAESGLAGLSYSFPTGGSGLSFGDTGQITVSEPDLFDISERISSVRITGSERRLGDQETPVTWGIAARSTMWEGDA